MDQSLYTKIIEEIERSGFPLEIDLTKQLRDRDILTFTNIMYQDDNEHVREIDVLALIFNETNEWRYGPCGIQLLVECKKTEKYPWVFFKEYCNPLTFLGQAYKIDYSTDLRTDTKETSILIGCMNSSLSRHHYNDHSIPIPRTYFEAFKKTNEPTAIYKAVTNILNGRRFNKNRFSSNNHSVDQRLRTFLDKFLIVLDGTLLLAINDDGKYSIEERDHILLGGVDTSYFILIAVAASRVKLRKLSMSLS